MANKYVEFRVFFDFANFFKQLSKMLEIHGWKAKDVIIYGVKSRHFLGVPVRVQNFVNTVRLI